MTRTITAVAFDFGGVLTHSAFDGVGRYAHELGLPPDALVSYFRDDPMMARLEVGEVSTREFMKYVCVDAEARHGIRLDIRRLAAGAAEGEVLNPAMIALVEEVGRWAATALVTNNVAGAAWREGFPYHLFTTVIDSSEVGFRKPDPRIWTELLARLDRPAGEVAFVDDLERNVTSAADAGLRALLYTSVATCRTQLRQLGLALA